MSSLEKVRYITKNYRALQGLRQVPIGVFLLTVAMSNSEAWPWYTMWKPVSELLVLALLFGAYWLIGLYYKRNFGQVQSALHSGRDTVKGVFFVLVIAVAFVIDLGLEPPVSVVGLTVAVWILSGSWEAGGLGVHYAFAAGLLVGASLMPLTGMLNAERFFEVGLPLSLGIATLVIGTIDHFILRHFLPPVPKEESSAVR